MKKTLIILMSIVFLILLLVFIYVYVNKDNSSNDNSNEKTNGIIANNDVNNPQNEINLSSCSIIVDTNKKDLCLMNIAINNYNFPTCNKLSSVEAIAGCYFEFAGQRNEPLICERDEIKNYVTKDGKNTTGPDFCYLTVVARNYFRDNFTQQDITTNCNKIKESQLKSGCLNYISLKNG